MPERRGAPGQRDWYGVVREVGLALVVAGVVVLLFIAYDLLGTNFAEQQSQARLAREFSAALTHSAKATSAPASRQGTAGTGPRKAGGAVGAEGVAGGAAHQGGGKQHADQGGYARDGRQHNVVGARPHTTQAKSHTAQEQAHTTQAGGTHQAQDISFSVPPGGALDHLLIPAIGVNRYVVEGVQEQDLQLGPGHYPGTPLPGQRGNVGIAGHRTTFGAPFFRLNELGKGDLIYLTDLSGTTWVYSVRQKWVVAPSDVAVLDPTRGQNLTLTTCNPRFWATTRLVVRAALVEHLARGAKLAGGLPTRLEPPHMSKGGAAGATSGATRSASSSAGSKVGRSASRTPGTTALPGGAGAATSPAGAGAGRGWSQIGAGAGRDSPVVGSAALALGGAGAWTWAGAFGFGALAVAVWVATRLLAARRRRYAKVAFLFAGALVSLIPLWFAFGAVVNLLPANF